MLYLFFVVFLTCFSTCVKCNSERTQVLDEAPYHQTARCRANCLDQLGTVKYDQECKNISNCYMCWDNCEMFYFQFHIWGILCTVKTLCVSLPLALYFDSFPGCKIACAYHNHHQIPTSPQISGDGFFEPSTESRQEVIREKAIQKIKPVRAEDQGGNVLIYWNAITATSSINHRNGGGGEDQEKLSVVYTLWIRHNSSYDQVAQSVETTILISKTNLEIPWVIHVNAFTASGLIGHGVTYYPDRKSVIRQSILSSLSAQLLEINRTKAKESADQAHNHFNIILNNRGDGVDGRVDDDSGRAALLIPYYAQSANNIFLMAILSLCVLSLAVSITFLFLKRRKYLHFWFGDLAMTNGTNAAAEFFYDGPDLVIHSPDPLSVDCYPDECRIRKSHNGNGDNMGNKEGISCRHPIKGNLYRRNLNSLIGQNYVKKGGANPTRSYSVGCYDMTLGKNGATHHEVLIPPIGWNYSSGKLVPAMRPMAKSVSCCSNEKIRPPSCCSCTIDPTFIATSYSKSNMAVPNDYETIRMPYEEIEEVGDDDDAFITTDPCINQELGMISTKDKRCSDGKKTNVFTFDNHLVNNSATSEQRGLHCRRLSSIPERG